MNTSPTLIRRALKQTAICYAVIGALLFGTAGTLHWPAAWVFIGGMLLLSVASTFWLARRDPGLLEERLKPPVQEGQGAADKVFVGVLGVSLLSWLVLMGLDARFAWSAVPPLVQLAGGLMLLAGAWICLLVFREN
ncbi:MAG TPA: isoprenylcysteine carboxylmethyltransferase family protein, partial [Burkholderiales bacterium]|nr:isoprenylcysteine carboxylmethyltransferase family protein [Burkholderiales bacterium]